MVRNSKRNRRRELTRTDHRHGDYFLRRLGSSDRLRALGDFISHTVAAICLCSVTLFILLSKHPFSKTILYITATLALGKTFFSKVKSHRSRHKED